eukprot:7519536-Pyramimonas_sp.AAC.1
MLPCPPALQADGFMDDEPGELVAVMDSDEEAEEARRAERAEKRAKLRPGAPWGPSPARSGRRPLSGEAL